MTLSSATRQAVILVVEDEPGIRDALDMLLELEGYDVRTASNGLEALELLEAASCDLVITDHMMPRMDGVTFVRHLRDDERLRELPVIMISAVPEPPAEAGRLTEAFIGKPFEVPRLLRAIADLLAGTRNETDPGRG